MNCRPAPEIGSDVESMSQGDNGTAAETSGNVGSGTSDMSFGLNKRKFTHFGVSDRYIG